MTRQERPRVLVVEDDPEDATDVREALQGARADGWIRATETTLASAQARLDAEPFDLVLLDLGLPDTDGVSGVEALCSRASPIPVIVMTGLDDETVGLEALKIGAQDYLIKGRANGEVVRRAILYGIERHQLLLNLNAMRERAERERELLRVASVSGSGTEVTQASLSDGPLRNAAPNEFERLTARYAEIVRKSMAEQAFKVSGHVADEVFELVADLGAMYLRPRDLIDIHVSAVKGRSQSRNARTDDYFVSEGRFVLIRALAYLASYYRNRIVKSRKADAVE